jgi:hypothetical protein
MISAVGHKSGRANASDECSLSDAKPTPGGGHIIPNS